MEILSACYRIFMSEHIKLKRNRLKIEATSLTRHDALHLKPGNFNFNIF